VEEEMEEIEEKWERGSSMVFLEPAHSGSS
jgi:hypothetical protein